MSWKFKRRLRIGDTWRPQWASQQRPLQYYIVYRQWCKKCNLIRSINFGDIWASCLECTIPSRSCLLYTCYLMVNPDLLKKIKMLQSVDVVLTCNCVMEFVGQIAIRALYLELLFLLGVLYPEEVASVIHIIWLLF